jgi:hypothetical protein
MPNYRVSIYFITVKCARSKVTATVFGRDIAILLWQYLLPVDELPLRKLGYLYIVVRRT